MLLTSSSSDSIVRLRPAAKADRGSSDLLRADMLASEKRGLELILFGTERQSEPLLDQVCRQRHVLARLRDLPADEGSPLPDRCITTRPVDGRELLELSLPGVAACRPPE